MRGGYRRLLSRRREYWEGDRPLLGMLRRVGSFREGDGPIIIIMELGKLVGTDNVQDEGLRGPGEGVIGAGAAGSEVTSMQSDS